MGIITKHAAIRMQQRGINEQTLDYLVRYGSRMHDNRGCLIVFFNKHSRKHLTEFQNAYLPKPIKSQMDAYAVVSIDGKVLTVGHRFKRIIRH
jgi:hypothetical protein